MQFYTKLTNPHKKTTNKSSTLVTPRLLFGIHWTRCCTKTQPKIQAVKVHNWSSTTNLLLQTDRKHSHYNWQKLILWFYITL